MEHGGIAMEKLDASKTRYVTRREADAERLEYILEYAVACIRNEKGVPDEAREEVDDILWRYVQEGQ